MLRAPNTSLKANMNGDLDIQHKSHYRFPLLGLVLTLVFCGGLLIVAYLPFLEGYGLIADLLKVTSVGVGISVAVAMIQSWYSSREITELVSATENHLRLLLRNTSDIVKNAQDFGIKQLIHPRFGEDGTHAKEFQIQIRKELEKAIIRASESVVTIRIMGITLNEFFGGELVTTMQKALKNNQIKFQVLVIDPLCLQAIWRSERESQTDREPQTKQEPYTPEAHLRSRLYHDFRISMSSLPDGENDIGTRVYDLAPSSHLVFINDMVFFENYYYGGLGDNRRGGGRIPTIVFDSTSETYRELQGHFEYVWARSKDKELNDALRKIIEEATRNDICNLPGAFPQGIVQTP
jgi:hypothetical protein